MAVAAFLARPAKPVSRPAEPESRRVGELDIRVLRGEAQAARPVAYPGVASLLITLNLTGAARPRAEGRCLAVGESLGHGVAVYDLEAGWSGQVPAQGLLLHLRLPRAAVRRPASGRAKAGGAVERHADGSFSDPLLWHLGSALVAATSLGTAGAAVDCLAAALQRHLGDLLAVASEAWRTQADRARGGLAPWREKLAKTLLSTALEDGVSLAEVADACGLSLSHFARAFKQSVGLPPHRWLLAQRLERAQSLLREGDMPLAEVAAACGFADQSHFTRVFSGRIGQTPALWRRLSKASSRASIGNPDDRALALIA